MALSGGGSSGIWSTIVDPEEVIKIVQFALYRQLLTWKFICSNISGSCKDLDGDVQHIDLQQ
jgi:hypothetical protein